MRGLEVMSLSIAFFIRVRYEGTLPAVAATTRKP